MAALPPEPGVESTAPPRPEAQTSRAPPTTSNPKIEPAVLQKRGYLAVPESHANHVTFPASLPIPDPVLAIARKLEDAGFETWCVGGAVRDSLLETPNKDFDLTTAAPPDKVRKLFRRTVPVGIEHGTVAVIDEHGQLHEVTTFRKDVRTDGRHAEVEFGVSLDDDLARRDFTINAIAYHPLKHDWRDPFDGRTDLLENRVIRAVGEPRVEDLLLDTRVHLARVAEQDFPPTAIARGVSARPGNPSPRIP